MKIIGMLLLLSCAPAFAQNTPASSFVTGTAADEAAIRAILSDADDDEPNTHVAPDLDWENAFGIRYTDLSVRDRFYHAYVKPLQKTSTDTTLEIKVRFLANGTAIADEYWHVIGQLDMATHKPGADRWGRTTYIFVKQNGVWAEVLERVADMRMPFYKHFTELPAAVTVAPATLAAYAGEYILDGHKDRVVQISLEGDHLRWTSRRGTLIGIPVSDTEFLLFDTTDLAEYQKLTFTLDPAGKTTARIVTEVGDFPGTLQKQP